MKFKLIGVFGIFLVAFATLIGCDGCTSKKKNVAVKPQEYDSVMINAHRGQTQYELTQIAEYAKKNNWPVQLTGTGISYWIYQAGKGALAQNGQTAYIKYEVSLLDGTVCYKGGSNGGAAFKIGHDHVESGLHEAILLLHVGDKAKVILPSYRAFGVTGDNDKIPSNASVVYDIELLKLD